MQIVAQAKSVRMSPRKVRLIADLIRNMPANRALDVLAITNKRAAMSVEKTLESAISNALQQANTAADSLYVATIEIGEGPAFKRFRPSTRGRVHRYKKRTSHIKIVLKENQDNKQNDNKKDVKEDEKQTISEK